MKYKKVQYSHLDSHRYNKESYFSEPSFWFRLFDVHTETRYLQEYLSFLSYSKETFCGSHSKFVYFFHYEVVTEFGKEPVYCYPWTLF